MGAAIIERFAAHGANVVVNYNSSAKPAEAVAEKCRSHGVKAICVKADVLDPAAIASLFEQAIQEFGGVDICYSNAGIEHFDNVENVKKEDVEKVFAVNVVGQFLVAQQALKYMRENGRLILTSSISAVWVST
jgi:NAD(P)-dependent dehydrogenase (short-subunit alcohol dehydrogenase family)